MDSIYRRPMGMGFCFHIFLNISLKIIWDGPGTSPLIRVVSFCPFSYSPKALESKPVVFQSLIFLSWPLSPFLYKYPISSVDTYFLYIFFSV